VAGVIGAGVVALLALMLFLGSRVPGRAQRLFFQQRRLLQEEFLLAATATGKPRGLRWKACDWGADAAPAFARARGSGQIVAFVPVTIQFEAVEGSDMEGLPAVGNLRNASAVFAFFGRDGWRPTGRALFNLNPDEVLTRFGNQYEPLQTK
jgi:hypothetical protein